MSGMKDLYREFRQGLDTTAGPEDTPFEDLWRLYIDVTGLVGVRFSEPRMGGEFGAADRVQWYLTWSEHVATICHGMPLNVPSSAVRALKAAGRYLEGTPHVDELGEFLGLTSPMVNDLSTYAVAGLGRRAKPVADELSLVSRAGSLMFEAVSRSVPGIEGGR